MKKTSLAVALSAAILATGCASIVSDSNYPVQISSNPSGANFVITNKSGDKVHSGITPTTVTLASSSGYFSGEDYQVTFTKDGYASQTTQIKAGMDGWYIGNVLFGGLIGLLIVDPATGAMFKLPEATTTTMISSETADAGTPSLQIMTIDQLSDDQVAQLQAIR